MVEYARNAKGLLREGKKHALLLPTQLYLSGSIVSMFCHFCACTEFRLKEIRLFSVIGLRHTLRFWSTLYKQQNMCPQKESKEPKMYTTGNYDSRSEDETFFDNGLTGLLGYPGVLWHIKEI